MVVKINENYLKLKSSYLFVEVARREAEFILNAIKGKQFEYPIWLDVEDITTLKWVLEMLPNR